jgi:hypothetical protein
LKLIVVDDRGVVELFEAAVATPMVLIETAAARNENCLLLSFFDICIVSASR